MRAIIYGYDDETNEYVELLNKGAFWVGNGVPYMMRYTMKLSKRRQMKTFLVLDNKGKRVAFLPTEFKFRHYGLFSKSSSDFIQTTEWRMRKIIPTIRSKGAQSTFWTEKNEFELPLILFLKKMDYLIKNWDKVEGEHIKTVSDFILGAVSLLFGEDTLEEAHTIMSSEDNYKEFSKEVEILGIEGEEFEIALEKYLVIVKQMIKEAQNEIE